VWVRQKQDGENTDWEKINHYVMEKQHLTSKCDDVLKCVEDIAGLNSVVAATPYLSLFNRVRNFKKSMLDEEMYEKKRLFRLRLMRGTLFVVTKDLLPIAYSATIDRTQKIYGRFRKYCNLSEKELDKLRNEIIKILKKGERTAKEIRKEIGIDNKNVSPVLRWLMEDIPLIRGRPLGTWKSEQFRYSLLPKSIELNMDEKKAKILLVEKFLESFGPATLKDLAWWSGFGKKESRDILKEVSAIDVGGGLLLLRKEAKDFENFRVDDESLLLMSGFDQYVITYRYSMCPRLVTEKNVSDIYNKYGELYDPIIRNGRIIGRWCVEGEKISHLLYEKLKDKTKFYQKIEEMEEFTKE
jgi:hypothetical protein